MTLSVQPVDVNYINQTWPMVEHFIMDAMDKGSAPEHRNYTVEQIRVFVTSGQWLLVVAVDETNHIYGCATVSFINYPLHRVAFVTAIGGKLISSRETFAQLKELLKLRGATKIQGMARESIARLWSRFGFEPRATLVEVQI